MVYRKQFQNFSNCEQYLERKYCFLVDCASYRSAMVAVWYTNADCDVNEVWHSAGKQEEMNVLSSLTNSKWA